MSKYGYPMYVAIFLALVLTVGCREQYKQINLRTPEHKKENDDSEKAEEEESGEWEDLVPEPSEEEEGTRPRFIDASDAEQAPHLGLTRFSGKDVEIDPARTGKVTIIVFWSMDSVANRAAVIYAYQLVREQSGNDLRGISIVEKPPTDSHRAAPEFLRAKGMNLPTYYDDFTALREMAEAAGVSVKWEIPTLFLIDKRGRVRLYKRGFSHTTSGVRMRDEAEARITENPAAGKGIKHYIEQLLKEE